MSLEQEIQEGHYVASGWPKDWKLYAGASTIFPITLIGSLVAGMSLVLEVKTSEAADTSLLSKSFTDTATVCELTQTESAAYAGLRSAFMQWDLEFDSKRYRVREGEVPVSAYGTGQLVEPTQIQLSELQQAIIDFNAIDTSGVDTVAANIGAVDTVAQNIGVIDANAADIGIVAGNIGDVETVSNNTADIDTVAANISDIVANAANIATVAGSISNVNDVGANIAAVSAVSANEANINSVAANLPDIQLVAPTLSMTNSTLSLVVDGQAAVAGVSYPSIQDAYDYAVTVLQQGGKLIISIPANTTITQNAQFSLVNNDDRISLLIFGADQNTSVIESTAFDGLFSLENLNAKFFTLTMRNNSAGAATLLTSDRGKLEATNVSFEITGGNSGAVLVREAAGHVHLRNCYFEGGATLVRFQNSSGTMSNNQFVHDGAAAAFSAQGVATKVDFVGADFDKSGSSTTGTAIEAIEGARVFINPAAAVTIEAEYQQNYDPPADSYGNYHSRIITVQ